MTLTRRSGCCRNNPTRGLAASPGGALDLPGAYRHSFEEALPHAGQVADQFGVIHFCHHKPVSGSALVDLASLIRVAGRPLFVDGYPGGGWLRGR